MSRVRLSADQGQALAAELLDREAKAVLCTSTASGDIHAVPIYFVPRPGSLLFSAYRRSQKVVNVARQPRCSVLVESGVGYHDLRGVLLYGRAEIVPYDEDAVASTAAAVYARYAAREPEPSEVLRFRAQAPNRVVVEFRWDRVAGWDHT